MDDSIVLRLKTLENDVYSARERARLADEIRFPSPLSLKRLADEMKKAYECQREHAAILNSLLMASKRLESQYERDYNLALDRAEPIPPTEPEPGAPRTPRRTGR